MNLTKFEAAGIALSIAVLVLALWIVRVQSVNEDLAQLADREQSAAVFIGDSENRRAAIADALIEAGKGTSDIKRLIIDDVVLGDGEVVEAGDRVTVHYIGTLQNGQQFDNSYERGEPFSFEVGEGRVIKGWEEGIAGMREGGQRILVIPPELGYGSEGFGPIPGNATLVFAVELLSVEE